MPTLIVPPATLPSAPTACAAVWFDGTTVLRQTEPVGTADPRRRHRHRSAGAGPPAFLALCCNCPAAPWRVPGTAHDCARSCRACWKSTCWTRWTTCILHCSPRLRTPPQSGWQRANAPGSGLADALEQAGHTVSRIVPEYHPLPSGEPTRLVVQGEADAPTLVACSDQGVALLPWTTTHSSCWTPTRATRPRCRLSLPWPMRPKRAFGACAIADPRRPCPAGNNGAWDLAQLDLVRSRSTRLRKQMGAALQAFWNAPLASGALGGAGPGAGQSRGCASPAWKGTIRTHRKARGYPQRADQYLGRATGGRCPGADDRALADL